MTDEQRQRIEEVFCEVLEKLAFVFGEPAGRDELPAPEGDLFEARMSYAGPTKGALRLAVSEGLFREIAANLLGIDEEADEARELAIDALKEVLNVVCGHVLTTVAGDDALFELRPPEAAAMDTGAWQQLARDEATLAFVVEDSPVLLHVADTG